MRDSGPSYDPECENLMKIYFYLRPVPFDALTLFRIVALGQFAGSCNLVLVITPVPPCLAEFVLVCVFG